MIYAEKVIGVRRNVDIPTGVRRKKLSLSGASYIYLGAGIDYSNYQQPDEQRYYEPNHLCFPFGDLVSVDC